MRWDRDAGFPLLEGKSLPREAGFCGKSGQIARICAKNRHGSRFRTLPVPSGPLPLPAGCLSCRYRIP